jgi:hypothetical protein
MFVRVVASRQAPSGKAAKARSAGPSEDSFAEHESDAATVSGSFSWSLRNLMPLPAAPGQPNSATAGEPGAGKPGVGKPGHPRYLLPLPSPLHAKLEVGAVDDPLEREADRAAAHVMRMPVPEPASDPENAADGSSKVHTANPSTPGHPASLHRKCDCGGTCDNCKAEQENDEHGKVQRKGESASPSARSTAAPAIVHQVISEPGDPLDAATRAFFEPRFAWDFSQVRVHSGARAADSAKAINARAYTVGNHIVFRNDESNRSGIQGRTLVAHELAHVIQQDAASSSVFAEHGAGLSQQSKALRRKPADEPDEPLDVALQRQEVLDRIAEQTREMREQMDAAQVDITEHEAQVAPFFVQEDPQVQRLERQIDSGRTQVPARLKKLQETLRIVAKDALTQSDDLDQLHARIKRVELVNSFMPVLLRNAQAYEALLKDQEKGEKDYADTIAFFEKAREQIEITKRILPERAAELKQRSQYLEKQAGSAASTAKVGPDTGASATQLALLRTIIEASPTLSPYLTQKRASGAQPTDLRDARRFVIHSSDSDLQDEAKNCHQGEAGPGTKIGGFYCRQTDTIHLPPDAKFGTALHEAIHKYSQRILFGACDQFLNEGLTQYFADIVLVDQHLRKFTGHAYQKQLQCATRFINTYHLDEVASAYFLGTAGLGTGPLHQFLLRGDRACTKFCAPEQGAADH